MLQPFSNFWFGNKSWSCKAKLGVAKGTPPYEQRPSPWSVRDVGGEMLLFPKVSPSQDLDPWCLSTKEAGWGFQQQASPIVALAHVLPWTRTEGYTPSSPQLTWNLVHSSTDLWKGFVFLPVF